MRIALFVLVVLALVVLPAGQAGTGYTIGFTGSSVETDTSGQGGGTRQYIGDDPSAGLRGVGWSEEADVPCYFESYDRDIDNGHDTFLGRYWEGCGGGTRGDDERVTVDGGGDLNPQTYVRGIAVCDNGKDNHRIKGIRLYRAKVWKTKKQIDELDGTTSASHAANCEQWRKAVFCPTGTIANTAVLHTDLQIAWTGAVSNAVQGISLLCLKVTWT